MSTPGSELFGRRYPSRIRNPVGTSENKWRDEIRESAKRDREDRAAARKEANKIVQKKILAGGQGSSRRSYLDNMAIRTHSINSGNSKADQNTVACIKHKDKSYKFFPQRNSRHYEEFTKENYPGERIKHHVGAPQSHLHAEMYAVLHYLRQGKKPSDYIQAIGASKEICLKCAHVLDYLNIQYDHAWTSTQLYDDWVSPWRLLPDGFTAPVATPPKFGYTSTDSDSEESSGESESELSEDSDEGEKKKIKRK